MVEPDSEFDMDTLTGSVALPVGLKTGIGAFGGCVGIPPLEPPPTGMDNATVAIPRPSRLHLPDTL